MSMPRTVRAIALAASLSLAACSTAATPAPTAAPSAGAPSASAGPTQTTDGTLPKPELESIGEPQL